MMDLSTDAEIIVDLKHDVAKEKLNKDILQKIEADLSIDEKISILFLMTNDYSCSFNNIYVLLNGSEANKANMLTVFIDKYLENWKSELLESICIVQNRQIIRKLGLQFSDLELLYVPKNRLYASNLNPVAKCLYLLCEALTESEIITLIQNVKRDLTEYDGNLENIKYLELHMLYWVQQNYISIYPDGRVKLKNLLKHVKCFTHLELIYEDLKKYESHQHVLDTRTTRTNSSEPQTFSASEGSHSFVNSEGQDLKQIKKGLCVIMNQMFFSGQVYETRFGTAADCIKLRQTFKGFGFKVFEFENLTKDDILENLENISKNFGTDYDCIFVCLLSHGCKGGIIASDEKEVTIEMIEQKICCLELKDVYKVVIIQACQGKVTGQVENSLTTDGPSDKTVSNISQYRNFCIFMSTMPGFLSVRHKAEGSWFIQEFCDTFQNCGNKLSFWQAVTRIIQSVEKKRGKLEGVNSIAQLPELRPYRLLTDFQLPEYCAQ